MRFALINNDIVESIIIANQAFADTLVGYQHIVDVTEASVTKNHIYRDGVFYKPESEEPQTTPNYLFLHITLTGGDGIDPIGMINDGVDAISISAAFRGTEDPTSNILTMISGMWRVVIRDSDRLVYDIIGVDFTEGVSTFQYKTTGKPAICKLKEADLNAIPIVIGETVYKIVLANPVEFKVYRLS